MYAVIETGGKQYRVELGSELAVERLEAAPGDTITFDRVLLVADGDAAQIGTPVVDAALVTADVLRQDRGDKVIVFKYRPKARHRAKKGHRQEQTVIRVADIRFNGRSAADEASAQQNEEAERRRVAQSEAQRKAAADQALAARLAEQAAEADAAASDDSQAEPPAKRTRTSKTTKATKTTAATPDTNGEPSADEQASSDGPGDSESVKGGADESSTPARRKPARRNTKKGE